MRRLFLIAAFALTGCHTLVMNNFNHAFDAKYHTDVVCRAIPNDAPPSSHIPRGQPGNVRAMADMVARAYRAGWVVESTGVESTGFLGMNSEHLVLCFAHLQPPKGSKAPAATWPPPDFKPKVGAPGTAEQPFDPKPDAAAEPAKAPEVAAPAPAVAPAPPAAPVSPPPPTPAAAPAPKDSDDAPPAHTSMKATTRPAPEEDEEAPSEPSPAHRRPILAPDDEPEQQDLTLPKSEK